MLVTRIFFLRTNSWLYGSQSSLNCVVLFVPPFTSQIIKFHFSYKKDAIQVRMQQWLAMCPLGAQKDLVRLQVESIDTELLHLAMAGVKLESM